MENAAVGTCGALSVVLLLLAHAQGAPSLGARLSDKRNASCPWRLNLVEDGNRVEGCIDELTISLSGTSSGSLTARALPGPDFMETPPDEPTAVPLGYKPLHGEHFYKLHGRPARWHAAKDVCEREGAHLVVLNSMEEMTAVRSLLGHPLYEEIIVIHVGFYMELVTVMGETLPFTWHERWARTEPTHPECGQMDSDGFLLVASCGSEKSFVCEYESTATTFTVSPPTSSSALLSSVASVSGLPDGYEATPGWNRSYYYWGSLKNNHYGYLVWQDAKGLCEGQNAHLAAFESEEETQAIIEPAISKIK